MDKLNYHPKSYLVSIRNVKRGLETRTKLLSHLESKEYIAKKLSSNSGISYYSVLHHLHLMEKEHIVARKGRRPNRWKLTGLGQMRLIEI